MRRAPRGSATGGTRVHLTRIEYTVNIGETHEQAATSRTGGPAPESEAAAAARYLEFLIASDEAPVDSEMLKRIDAARAQNGPGMPHEEILREFGA